MPQPTGYNVTTLPPPSSSSQHHERATAPRCAVSSCFGKHVRSVAHHIYSCQLFLGCCFCSASFGTKHRHSRTQQQQCKEHATTSIPIAPSSRQRHALVTDTRCTRCTLLSCFAEPEVRHPSYTSNSPLDLCSAAEATSYLDACTLLPIHARGCRARGAVPVQPVVLLLLYELTSSSLCSLPWQLYGFRRQPREGSSTYANHTCLLLLPST